MVDLHSRKNETNRYKIMNFIYIITKGDITTVKFLFAASTNIYSYFSEHVKENSYIKKKS